MNIREVTLSTTAPYMWDISKFDNVIIWTTVPTAVMADNKSMNHKVAVSVAFPTYLRNVRGKNQVVWFLAGQSNDKVNLMWW